MPTRTTRRIVLLARAPSAPGKTRLTQHLDDRQAVELRRALLLDTLDAALATGIACAISFMPEDARGEIAGLAHGLPLFPQRGDDLGERMRHALAEAFAAGAHAAVLIGSDLPALPPHYLVDAFSRLEEQRGGAVVLGPTADGGFYLIGSCAPLPDLFGGIDWRGADVLKAVTSAARAQGLAVALLPPWWDVDVPEDLQRVRDQAPPHAARRVRAWLA